ncbi:hypothetical protein [Streptomyces mirabilis]|uniref:hypothetical protein n=1 Tax=Streptomyces mirabilis TaxID=68239 RepID=UPI00224E430A|nr:hypothetical protein [Streptomyces mirabilis]MCX4615753.1 hypothetical protein [Streptomyces mirabilis]
MVVGITLAAHGIVTDFPGTYRTGFVLLVIGLAGFRDARLRTLTERLVEDATERVVEHATNVGRLSLRERQSFAEMGYKAALLSVDQKPPAAGGAEIHEFPAARRDSEMRRNGSA